MSKKSWLKIWHYITQKSLRAIKHQQANQPNTKSEIIVHYAIKSIINNFPMTKEKILYNVWKM